MNKKFAFTLAEILIVLTIIGVMAVMTIPSLMQNANSQHKITMFKKGFNAISNAYATEFATKTPPRDKNDAELLWNALNNQLNVKYYVDAQTGNKYYTLADAKNIDCFSRVIITEDKIGYRVGDHGTTECETKLNINKQKGSWSALNYTCLSVGVLIDGAEVISNKKECNDNNEEELSKLNCNAIWFPVSKDGITSGSTDCTIMGRIISNTEKHNTTICN